MDQSFIARYARGPNDTTVQRAISLHQNVRDLLGDRDYHTLLQGSYKNDTALADMNDVDILVVRKSTQQPRNFWETQPDWPGIFSAIERTLEGDGRYRGKWKREDKCIRLETGVRVDIVPAIHSGDPTTDPVHIYSFRDRAPRKNWPRGHYEGAARKSGETSGAFKQAVRLFKRWVRCTFGEEKVAPSYYVECLVHSLPSSKFTGELSTDFVELGAEILRAHPSMWPGEIRRISGEGNLLGTQEWALDRWGRFRSSLEAALVHARVARSEVDAGRARAAWVRAFNGWDR